LQVIRADGSRRRYLWRVPGPAGRPSWTPDGKSIAVTAGPDPESDFLYTVAIRSGRIEKRLLLESGIEARNTVATLSPNGRTVAFIGRRPSPPGCQQNECEVFALYLKRASGGVSRPLIDDGGPVGWSSDGRTVIYAYHGGFRLHPLQGGTVKTVEMGAENALGGVGPPALQPR
jgi:Tol biopolymer transport system component